MKKSVFIVSIVSIVVLITSGIFTGCSGQRYLQHTEQQYAYTVQVPSGWAETTATDLELSLIPNGDLQEKWFTDKDGTYLQIETRIVNNYSQYEQVKTYTNIPCEELRYTNYTYLSTSVDGINADQYAFTVFLYNPKPAGSKGMIIWFSSTKYKYVITYLALDAKLFDTHYDVYQKAISTFVAN